MVSRRKSGRSFGFTLLEMMIVIIIMGILLAIALPIYNQSIVRAREVRAAQRLVRTAATDLPVHARQAKGAAVAGRSGVGGLHQASSQGSDDE